MAKPNSKWYKLDSAGTLYSALQKEEYSAIYRFSALMEKDVDPAALQRAIDRCMPRFPTFAVRIRKGAFWYYLEHNSAPGPFLKEDVSDPCQPVRFKEDNGWLVRFYYYRNRISIEVFHALSDGGGAIVFFRTLLAEYLRQTGVDIPAGNGVLDLNEPPREEEMEDAYARYAGHHALGLHRQPTAYQNTGTSEPFYTFHVTMGFVPLSKLREESKSTARRSPNTSPLCSFTSFWKSRSAKSPTACAPWRWPSPSICAAGSRARRCETSLPPSARISTPRSATTRSPRSSRKCGIL